MLTGALCVVAVVRQWIICCYIVKRLIGCGALSLGFFGISWVPSCMVSNFLFSWWNWLGKHSSYIWNLVSLCLMWCVWREFNWRSFADLDRSEDQMLALFSGSLFDWVRAWGLTFCDFLPLFLSSLSL